MVEMDASEIFEGWNSVKKFSDESVSKKTLTKIFEKTTVAPTAFNLQPYRFIVLDSEKEKAVNAAIPVNKWVSHADKIAVLVGFEDINRNAERVLARKVTSGEIDEEKAENLRKMFENYNGRSEEFLAGWITRNAMIPAAFFLLACRSEGVGACPVRGFDREKLSDSLNLGTMERPLLLIPIGYPKEDGDRHWRRDADEIFEIR